jgi:Spy/CpxP family protein refolding chaperone
MKPIETWGGRLQAIVLAVAAVTLVAATSVAARQEWPGPGGGNRRMGPAMPLARLNLTAEQKTQVKAIMDKHRDAEQATFGQLRTARESLHKAIFGSPTPDTTQIETLTGQITELEGKALRARVARELEVASILTDEQRQQMATMQPRGPRRGPRPRG